jgi:hypothetical protein
VGKILKFSYLGQNLEFSGDHLEGLQGLGCGFQKNKALSGT